MTTLSQILENEFSSGVSQDTKPGRQILLVAYTSVMDKKVNNITLKHNKSFYKNLKSLSEAGEQTSCNV